MTLTTIPTRPRLASGPLRMGPILPRQLRERDAMRPPTLGEALRLSAPIPPWAVFIGLAHDGLPVLLNLRGSSPSPVLIAADSGTGKTQLLRVIASAVDQIQDPDRVRYAVITDAVSEWNGCEQSLNCEGILSFHHALTTGYVASLAHSAQVGRMPASQILLLIDDVQSLITDGDLGDSVRWLLRMGPAHGIWPVASLNTSRPPVPETLLSSFGIRLLGTIRERETASALSGSSSEDFASLHPASEFAMKEGDGWLPFLVPVLE